MYHVSRTSFSMHDKYQGRSLEQLYISIHFMKVRNIDKPVFREKQLFFFIINTYLMSIKIDVCIDLKNNKCIKLLILLVYCIMSSTLTDIWVNFYWYH